MSKKHQNTVDKYKDSIVGYETIEWN